MKALVILFVSIALLGCKSSKKESAATEGKAEPTPPAVSTSTDASASASPDRQERVNAALLRVPEITKGVAELRDLAFKQPVPAEYQEQADFRAFVRAEIQRELPPKKNIALGKALLHIGLLPEPLDLAKTLEDAMVTQAGAYYDPKTKKFYLVMVPNSNLLLDTISSHELTHALQDQHFNLNQYYYGHDGEGPPVFSEDQLAARRFIVEGEASFVMLGYAGYSMAKMNMFKDKNVVKTLGVQLEMMANMSIEELKEMSKAQSASFLDMGEDIKKSMESMDDIPLYVLIPLLDAYMKGARPVYEAFVAGGWDAVNELYTTSPPDSTEQVLHPKEKLIPNRDYPVAISLDTPGEPFTEVMGELGWRVYFEVWKYDKGVEAAAGWDGDRYAVWEADGRQASVTATIWDSEAEATEFRSAYLATLSTRFPDGASTEEGGVTFKPRGDGVIALQTKGTEVWIADGRDNKEAARHLKIAARRTLVSDERDK